MGALQSEAQEPIVGGGVLLEWAHQQGGLESTEISTRWVRDGAPAAERFPCILRSPASLF